GYMIAHRAFNSRAVIARGSIYRLSQLVPTHDVVIVGQILVHLRDPWTALRETAACCADTLIIIEGSFKAKQPVATFVGGGAATGYWHISNALYRDWLDTLGFTIASEASALYECRHPRTAREHRIWTFVARRKELMPAPDNAPVPMAKMAVERVRKAL